MSGIDTTSTGAPQLYYSTDGGTTWSSTTYGLGSNNQFDAGELVSIGTCSSTSTECKFKARVDLLSFGDDFQYYWKFQDTNVNSQGNGAERRLRASADGYANDADPLPSGHRRPRQRTNILKKMTVLTTDATSRWYTNAPTNLDRQMTYYSDSDEYFFEFDTSACGTGTNACFFLHPEPSWAGPERYGNWIARGNVNPGYQYSSWSYGMNKERTSSTRPLEQQRRRLPDHRCTRWPRHELGLLVQQCAMKNLPLSVWTPTTGIDAPLTGGDAATASMTYGWSYHHASVQVRHPRRHHRLTLDVQVQLHRYHQHGKPHVRDHQRLVLLLPVHQLRPLSSSLLHDLRFHLLLPMEWFRPRYKASEALCTGAVTYKVGNVAPTPDTFKPDLDHSPLKDSHASSRTIAVTISMLVTQLQV